MTGTSVQVSTRVIMHMVFEIELMMSNEELKKQASSTLQPK